MAAEDGEDADASQPPNAFRAAEKKYQLRRDQQVKQVK
jgi:hypothetical protein